MLLTATESSTQPKVSIELGNLPETADDITLKLRVGYKIKV
jgi:hypothetical protein